METCSNSDIISQSMIVTLVLEYTKTNLSTPIELCSRIICPKTLYQVFDVKEQDESTKSVLLIRQVLAFFKTSSILYTKDSMREMVHTYYSSNTNMHDDENTNNNNYNNNNNEQREKRDSLLRIIQIQVILRLSLFTYFSSTQDIQSSFLVSYADLFFCRNKNYHKNVRNKHFTIAHFGTELRSFLELSHFILPQDVSFRNFLMSTVCEPFPDLHLATTIVSFFEIFPSDHSDDDDDKEEEDEINDTIRFQSLLPSSSSTLYEKGIKSNLALHTKIQAKELNIQHVFTPSILVQENITGTEQDTMVNNQQDKKTSSMKVNLIPLTTQSNLRNRLVSRQKYVGNHFSDNVSSLFHEVKMAPPPTTTRLITTSVNNTLPSSNYNNSSHNKMVIPKNNYIKTMSDKKKTIIKKSSVSPTRSNPNMKEIQSPSVHGNNKDPSQYVAAAMKFRSKQK